MKRSEVYGLVHEYYIDAKYAERKFIGLFSSYSEAEEAIAQFFVLPGFRDHPRECFKIERHEVDNYDKWKKGFTEEQLTLLY